MTARGTRFALEGVSLQYRGTAALAEVRLEIEPGESVAFVGPSGAGKTSLLHLLNGTRRPTAGRVLVDGRSLAELSPREMQRMRSRIGFIHQDLSLVANLRVAQNVLAGRLGQLGLLGSLRAMVAPGQAALDEVHALLDRVGIESKLFQRTDRLSGGEQQRVAMARALYQRPAALIADEPVSSVDPARGRDGVDLLTRISREERLTLCVSLHSIELAREFFPRLIGMRDGRIVFDRPSAQVRDEDLRALYDLSVTANGREPATPAPHDGR